VRALVQRVREARVVAAGRTTGAIGRGLVAFVGIAPDDGVQDRDWLVRKLAHLRIFDDDAGVMNRSVQDVGGEILAVSQFTLYAATDKGNRPSYSAAAPPEVARPRFDDFVGALAAALGRPVPTGEFGAHMDVAVVNDGPVTIWLDTRG
jgi:D-tyrosyl-tRNA(Tyr) deacylase